MCFGLILVEVFDVSKTFGVLLTGCLLKKTSRSLLLFVLVLFVIHGLAFHLS